MGEIAGEKERKIVRIAGLFLGIFVFTAAAVFLYSPVIKTHASSTYVNNDGTKVNAKLQPIVALTIDTNRLRFEMNPTSSGSFKSLPINVSVTTNDPSGYEIYMSALESVDLTNSDTTDKVSSLTESATSADMPINTWGYSLDNVTFHAIPSIEAPSLIVHTDSRDSSTTTINYGVKVNTDLEKVTYSDTLVITAVPNSANNFGCGGGFFCIEYMQEMTPEICAETTTPLTSANELVYEFDEDPNLIPRTSLKDIRDNKNYLVTKLADGNCWMSQDLDLRLTAGSPLESETTDLNTRDTWVPTSTTGSLVREDEWSLSLDSEWRDDGDATNSVNIASKYSYDEEVTLNANTTLYSWKTATAGGEKDSTYYNTAANSICPKGWQLPNHSWAYYYINDSTSAPASWYNLFETYGGSNGNNYFPSDFAFPSSWDFIFDVPNNFSYSTGYIVDGYYTDFNPTAAYKGVDDVGTGSSYYLTNGGVMDDYNSVEYLRLNPYDEDYYVTTNYYDITEGSWMSGMAVRCVARYEDE